MAEATIVEKPVTDTTTEADLEALTEDADPSITEDNNDAQTDEVTEPISDEPDPEATAIAAIREAAIEEGRELARQEQAIQRNSARDAESRRQLREHFPETVRKVEAELANLGITDPQARQSILNHLNTYNLTAQRAILAPFEDAVQELIPAAVREKFNAEADGKSAGEFQRTFAEFMADSDPGIRSRVIKSMTLDDFEKSSAKNKAALAERDLDKYRAGRTKGRTDPAGESHGTERSAPQTGPGKFRTKTEARAMRVRGEIDNTVLRTALANPNLPD